MSPLSPIWPSYARIDPGRVIAAVTVVERSAFDDGAVRQVRRFTATPERRQIRAWLLGSTDGASTDGASADGGGSEAGVMRSADDDLTRFRAWARTNAHRPFRFPGESGGQMQMRVVGGDGGIRYRAHVSAAGRRIWELELELETT